MRGGFPLPPIPLTNKHQHQPGWARVTLHGQLGVAAAEPGAVDEGADVGPDDGQAPSEAGDGAEEVAEEYEDAVELDAEADERPPQQDQQEPRKEGCRALGLLPPREEQQRLLWADYDGEADEEEDLLRRGAKKVGFRSFFFIKGWREEEGFSGEGVGGSKKGGRKGPLNSHGSVKKQHHASDQEEAS
ncbi:hypothetical protein DL764_005409 [Monosporascus ibericus]|uniref:Uncharacterized protein n=1 Tax=Monosporascus ibericus TaxID=155417 RepID=A0A4Q4TCA2_9PEZI|nr:hypothetical protein DL764_005409 [Monosporascus ibericus]